MPGQHRIRLAPALLPALLALACTAGFGQGTDSAITTSATDARVISLDEALRLARAYSPQFQAAQANAVVAHENRLQARDARLPTVNALNQFIYTQGNGTPSGVFIANDGVHVYNEQAVVRENLFSIIRSGQSLQARAAETVAIAQAEIARRGLVATVVQSYYNLVTAQRKIVNGRDSLRGAMDFDEVTRKQETAGVISHVDVVKAELQVEQRSRDLQSFELTASQAHLALAVLLFPHFNEDFAVDDKLAPPAGLTPFEEVKVAGFENNPDLRSARAAVGEAEAGATVARYDYLPSLAFNFYYGIDANQLQATASNVYGATKSTQTNNVVNTRQNLGYAGDLTLDIPLWNWGTTRSKVRAAEASVHVAQVKASFAERELVANLHSSYQQTEVARKQVDSLARSRDLAEENLHLTMLRYQAGEATALDAVSAEDSLCGSAKRL